MKMTLNVNSQIINNSPLEDIITESPAITQNEINPVTNILKQNNNNKNNNNNNNNNNKQ